VFARAATLAHLDRAEEANATLARGEALFADVTNPVAAGWAAFGGGIARTQLGDLTGAEALLRRGVEALSAIGERSWTSSLAPYLGEAMFGLGDSSGARRMAELGRELSAPTDRHGQAGWRALLARLEAAEGRLEEATRLADEAVEWAERTDQTDTIAEVHAVRAEVHQRAGRLAQARSDMTVALQAFERKGSVTGARRVRESLAAMSGIAP
jgi:tetratricopeptide (TPR) repeat protein